MPSSSSAAVGPDGFGRGKTIFILAIVVGCFGILWPKIFYPMFTASMNGHGDEGKKQFWRLMYETIWVKNAINRKERLRKYSQIYFSWLHICAIYRNLTHSVYFCLEITVLQKALEICKINKFFSKTNNPSIFNGSRHSQLVDS